MLSKGDKKLFLIDAYALIYRAYFAFSKNPRITTKGFDTSAIFGFTNMLFDLINNEKPDYLAIVFDTPKKTHRHTQYEAYKANRDAMPEGISTAIPYIKKMIDCFNISSKYLDGFEADDIIGTIAYQASAHNFTTYLMTPDKDFAQLIDEKTFMYRPGNRGGAAEIWDANKVCEKFGINHVLQVVDVLGMVGDPVDNIPGIAGVGPKTASKLLKEYDTIEELYKHIDNFNGKLKEKLIESKDRAFLSKGLAKIITNAPITIDFSNLKFSKPNLNELSKLCDELEFKNLYKRISAKFSSHPLQQSSQLDLFNVPIQDYGQILKSAVHIRNIDKLRAILNQKNIISISIHLEEYGVSFRLFSQELYYIIFDKMINLSKVINILGSVLSNKSIEKILYDHKSVLKRLGLESTSIVSVFDIALAEYLINPEGNRTLLIMSQKYDINVINLAGLDSNNPKDQAVCLIESTRLTFLLKDKLSQALRREKLSKLFYDLETPLSIVLANMELIGVKIDVSALKAYSKKLKELISGLKNDIYHSAGEKFNVSSPKQLGIILFDKLNLSSKPKKTKSGQFSTSESELIKLRSKHKIIDMVLLYRTYHKLLSTYVDALPLLISPIDQKIHTTFNQLVTSTGRLSSSKPNLQNIPIRRGSGKEVRRAFIPSSSQHILMSADYSQIELRLIAEMSKEDNMIEAFLRKEDIHASTASKVFNVPINNVTASMRTHAKTVNFGIIYGVSAFGLSEQTNLSRSEASKLIKLYFESYPKLKLFFDKNISFARENGYVKTILGRKRQLYNINSRNAFIRGHDERNAVNMPVQGSAADIIKLAMVGIHKEFKLKGLKSKMILQVHDELVFDVLKIEKDVVFEVVKTTMENCYSTTVPLKVEIGFGENWLEAH